MENYSEHTKRGVAYLALAAFIWGTSFVAQSVGGKAFGAYTFNSVRFIIGGLFLIPMVLKRKEHFNKLVVKAGILCGIALFVASNLQQVAIVMGAGTGKAGFLTAVYIVIVPIIGLFFGKKVPIHVWIAVVITMAGMYLLCLSEELVITGPDILLILCAVAFSVQILAISKYSPKTDPIILSCIEFFVCGAITFIPALFAELIPHTEIVEAAVKMPNAWISMLYCGILSSGIAYTLQIAGQKYVNPTIACLLMSLEAVFSALAGWVVLGETLSLRETMGCILIFVAVIMAQVTLPGKPKEVRN